MLLLGLVCCCLPSRLPADTLYVSDEASNTIARFDLATGLSLGVLSGPGVNLPRGLAFDASGNLYVADYGGKIEKFDPAGNYLSTFAASTNLYGGFGLAMDGQGNFYVAVRDTSTIQKVDATGTVLGSYYGVI